MRKMMAFYDDSEMFLFFAEVKPSQLLLIPFIGPLY
jgi:hypothetical protein